MFGERSVTVVVDEQHIEVERGVCLRLLVTEPATESEPITFLLVHGLASNARLWDGVAAELAALGYASAAVDLRGHGPLGRTHDLKPDDLTHEVITADLAAIIERLGWDRPIVVGQSWGGNVAVELAARHPGAVRGVAAIDGGTIELADYFADFDACAAVLSPPNLLGTPMTELEAYLQSAHPDWPTTGIEAQLANFEVLPDGTVAPWLAREHHMAILRHLYQHRPSSLWPALRDVPVLFMPAENDSSPFDKRAEVAVAEAALGRVRVLWTRGDHDLHAQFPNQVAARLRDACVDGFFS